jgi:predicted dehydrogenase
MFMGRRDAQMIAICDVVRGRRDHFKATVDEHYGNQDCKTYADYRELLDRPETDAVIIATQDHWHCPMVIRACMAGKDAYCEKPLSRFISEGREAVKAVRRYGRVVQVGNQGRSNPAARVACELVRNGRLGRLSHVEVMTGAPAPLSQEMFCPKSRDGGGLPDAPPDLDWDGYVGPAVWRPFDGFARSGDFRAGALEDFGGHVVDMFHRAMGFDYTGPVQFTPEPGYMAAHKNSGPMGILKYADGTVALLTSVSNPMGNCGVKIVGERGQIAFRSFGGGNTITPPELAKEPIRPEEIHLYDSRNHGQNFLDCVRSRRDPVSDIEVGHRTMSVCHIAEIALRLDRPLKWDPVKEEFLGDEEANRWRTWPYRALWNI